MDAGSADEDDEELNPYESVPMEISSDHFPPLTRFVQVAAGDSCRFALTDAGYVFGWGTFLVCCSVSFPTYAFNPHTRIEVGWITRILP